VILVCDVDVTFTLGCLYLHLHALHRQKYNLPARINIVFLILSLCQTCSYLLRAFCCRLPYSERHHAVASSGGRLCLTISTILRKVKKYTFGKFMAINDNICVLKYNAIRHMSRPIGEQNEHVNNRVDLDTLKDLGTM